MMVGESTYVFTKRVLSEKHISGIMYENSGRRDTASSTDAHACYHSGKGERRVSKTKQVILCCTIVLINAFTLKQYQ